MNHAESRDAVEEANAAIGAAVSAGALPHDAAALLDEIQHDLLDLADSLDHGRPAPAADRLRRALDGRDNSVLPLGFAVLAGVSAAAGLLKLARAVVRRAARTAAADDAREYLTLLADVLLTTAFRVEEHELAQFPIGWCIEPMWSDQQRGHIDTLDGL